MKNRFSLDFLLLICLSLLMHVGFAQNQEAEAQYLENNQISLTALKETSPQKASFDSLLNGYRVYMGGENHRPWRHNYQVQLALFKYFYHNHGVRVLLVEASPSQAFLDELYLIYGDRALQSADPQIRKRRRHFLDLLREFYLSLPENDRFVIRGLDIEDPESLYYAMFGIFEFTEDDVSDDPPAIYWELQSYAGNFYDAGEEWDFMQALESNWKIDSAAITTYLGLRNTNYLEQLLDGFSRRGHGNSLYRNTYSEVHDTMRIREDQITENFYYTLQEFPDARFFGQFGRFHVGSSPTDLEMRNMDWQPFISRANNDPASPVYKKVCSIPFAYTRSGVSFEMLSMILQKRYIPLFTKYNKEKVPVLFALDNDDSPFHLMAYRFRFLLLCNYWR